MARLPRLAPIGVPQHVIQRGNNRQTCFRGERDFGAYAGWLRDYALEYSVQIHAWVLMTNHIHLLVTPETEGGVSRMMQALGRMYVRYFNRECERSGTLWEGRYRSCLVQSERYLLQCYRYIELNPVRAGLVSAPGEYQWSSHAANAFGKPSSLLTPHPEYLTLGQDSPQRMERYRGLFAEAMDGELSAAKITALTDKGLALGDEEFSEQLEARYRRRVTPGRVGRPRLESAG